MAFCAKCGKEIDDEAVVCVHCGCPTGVQTAAAAPAVDLEAKASGGEKVLSFLIPIAGIILYCVNKGKKPKAAKTCLKISLITWLIVALITVLGIVISGQMAAGQLKSANSNAKLVFTTVNNELADMAVDGISISDSVGVHEFSMSNYNRDDAIEKAAVESLKVSGVSDGYVTFIVKEDYSIAIATWRSSQSASVYGQYPNPIQ